jgi:hypothetical protein
MRAYLYLPFLLLLAACTTLSPKSPQDSINEANVVLTASYKQLGENVKNKVTTKEEAQKVLSELDKLSKGVDDAQILLRAGNPLQAENQIKLLNSALISLQKKLAEKK